MTHCIRCHKRLTKVERDLHFDHCHKCCKGHCPPHDANELFDFASEIVTHTLEELDRGKWAERFKTLDDAERRILFALLSDGFGDSPDE